MSAPATRPATPIRSRPAAPRRGGGRRQAPAAAARVAAVAGVAGRGRWRAACAGGRLARGGRLPAVGRGAGPAPCRTAGRRGARPPAAGPGVPGASPPGRVGGRARRRARFRVRSLLSSSLRAAVAAAAMAPLCVAALARRWRRPVRFLDDAQRGTSSRSAPRAMSSVTAHTASTWAASRPTSTSSWAAPACSGLPPPSRTPDEGAGQGHQAHGAGLVQGRARARWPPTGPADQQDGVPGEQAQGQGGLHLAAPAGAARRAAAARPARSPSWRRRSGCRRSG